MKKTSYMTPAIEVVKLQYQKPLLEASSGESSIITPPTTPSDEPNLE